MPGGLPGADARSHAGPGHRGSLYGATADPGAADEPKGVRAPGLHLPWVAAVGTFHRDGRKTLYAVRSGRRTVVVQLDPGPSTSGCARVVVAVEDPRAVVDAVTRELAG